MQGDFGSDTTFGGGGSDRIRSGGSDDVAWGGSGADAVHGGDGPDELHGGSGPDAVYGGYGRRPALGWPRPRTRSTAVTGDDVLHALADDDDPDTLLCGPGRDVARVRKPERTTIRGCETIVKIVTPSADEAAGEADRDADAE